MEVEVALVTKPAKYHVQIRCDLGRAYPEEVRKAEAESREPPPRTPLRKGIHRQRALAAARANKRWSAQDFNGSRRMADPKTTEVKKRKQRSASDLSAKLANKRNRRKFDPSTYVRLTLRFSLIFPKIWLISGKRLARGWR